MVIIMVCTGHGCVGWRIHIQSNLSSEAPAMRGHAVIQSNLSWKAPAMRGHALLSSPTCLQRPLWWEATLCYTVQPVLTGPCDERPCSVTQSNLSSKVPRDERPPSVKKSNLSWKFPVMRGHPVLSPLALNVLWSFITNATSDLRPPAFCGYFHCAKGVVIQDRIDCII